jgi:ataxin-3
MARNRAIMERMLREQEMAQREVYEDEIARFQARGNPDREGEDEDEDEDEDREMDDVENAIAESRASARTEGHEQIDDFEDELSITSASNWARRYRLPGSMPLAGLPPFARVYDDDDQALQHALQASLETVPPGYVLPDLRQPEPPRAPLDNNDTPPALVETVDEDDEDVASSSETDASFVNAPSPSEASEEVSVEELRRRRLARFGGK